MEPSPFQFEHLHLGGISLKCLQKVFETQHKLKLLRVDVKANRSSLKTDDRRIPCPTLAATLEDFAISGDFIHSKRVLNLKESLRGPRVLLQNL